MVTETLLGELAPVNQLAVAKGTYLELVGVVVPDTATAGSRVDVSWGIKNNWTASVLTMGVIIIDGTRFWWITGPEFWIPAKATQSFSGYFTMPGEDAPVEIRAYFMGADGLWYLDDSISTTVCLPVAVGWQLLDSRSLSVRAAVAPPVGWQLLDSRTLSVKSAAPPVVGWQLLDSTTVGVTAGPPVSDWELIQHTIYYWAYFYEGAAGKCEFEFTLPPEEIPWTESIAKKVVEELASRLEAEGSKLLEFKIYLDRAGPLWSRWKGEITVADIEQGGVSGIAIAPALAAAMPWIIKGAIIAAVVLVIYFAIISPIITVFFKPKTLSEDVKRQWERETLILAITDLRPAYSRQALEEMTDQELRDLLNEVYEEEVGPPAGISWLWVALIGGLAVSGSAVGVYALSRFLPKKKE